MKKETKTNTLTAISSHSVTTDSAATRDVTFCNDRRRSLKFFGAAASTAAAAGAFPGIALAGQSLFEKNTVEEQNIVHGEPTLGINIVISKSVRSNWIVVENLSNQIQNIHTFAPTEIAYRNQRINLNALIRNEGRAIPFENNVNKPALEFHPDYAWSTSLEGVSSQSRITDRRLTIESISADTSIIKLWAVVNDGIATLEVGVHA